MRDLSGMRKAYALIFVATLVGCETYRGSRTTALVGVGTLALATIALVVAVQTDARLSNQTAGPPEAAMLLGFVALPTGFVLAIAGGVGMLVHAGDDASPQVQR